MHLTLWRRCQAWEPHPSVAKKNPGKHSNILSTNGDLRLDTHTGRGRMRRHNGNSFHWPGSLVSVEPCLYSYIALRLVPQNIPPSQGYLDLDNKNSGGHHPGCYCPFGLWAKCVFSLWNLCYKCAGGRFGLWQHLLLDWLLLESDLTGGKKTQKKKGTQ